MEFIINYYLLLAMYAIEKIMKAVIARIKNVF